MPFCGKAQYRLHASHELKSTRNHTFDIGDEMRFKTYKDNIYFTGVIEGIEDSLIHFEGFMMPLRQIKKIDLSGLSTERFNFKNYYTYLPLGALLFVGADLVNNPGFNISPGIAIAAGAMVGAAIIFYCLHRRVANRDRGWHFSVLNY